MKVSNGLRRVGDERETTAEGVIERRTKTVDVRCRVGCGPAKQFRRKILRCSIEFRATILMKLRDFAG